MNKKNDKYPVTCDALLQDRVISYITETYQVKVERPWAKYPDNITFKDILSDKWFALILPVEKSKLLGLQETAPRLAGNAAVWSMDPKLELRDLLRDESLHNSVTIPVLNVKAETEFIRMVSGNKGYQPGYHMNKDHWLSIYLDGSVDFGDICACIEQSFRLVTDSPTRRIYEAVKQIPAGHVATYGQVAAMAGNPKMSRAVGNALHMNPDPKHIPCFRVVNAKGELAGAFAFGGGEVQAELLRADGVDVVDGRVDLRRFGI